MLDYKNGNAWHRFSFDAHTRFGDPNGLKGAIGMRQGNDPAEDLDDLIFDEDDGGPSER